MPIHLTQMTSATQSTDRPGNLGPGTGFWDYYTGRQSCRQQSEIFPREISQLSSRISACLYFTAFEVFCYSVRL